MLAKLEHISEVVEGDDRTFLGNAEFRPLRIVLVECGSADLVDGGLSQPVDVHLLPAGEPDELLTDLRGALRVDTPADGLELGVAALRWITLRGSISTVPSHSGQLAGGTMRSAFEPRLAATTPTTYGMISPAFSTSIVSPRRMSFLRIWP